MMTDRAMWRLAREGLVMLPLLAACSSDPITLAPSTAGDAMAHSTAK